MVTLKRLNQFNHNNEVSRNHNNGVSRKNYVHFHHDTEVNNGEIKNLEKKSTSFQSCKKGELKKKMLNRIKDEC